MNQYGEPWRVDMDGEVVAEIQRGNGERVVETDLGAYPPELPDAARIVACVNACAGMDDPAAEIARLREIASNDPYPGVEGADE